MGGQQLLVGPEICPAVVGEGVADTSAGADHLHQVGIEPRILDAALLITARAGWPVDVDEINQGGGEKSKKMPR